MACSPKGCGCSFVSETLSISVAGDVVTIEQAEFTDITELQDDVAALQAQMTAAEAAIGTLQTDLDAAEAAITILNGLFVVTFGGAAVTTSGTADSIVASTVYTPPSNGILVLLGQLYRSQTVGTDQFDVRLIVNGTSHSIHRQALGTSNPMTANPMGAVAVVGGVALTLQMWLTRTTGTGTASTVADGRFNRMTAVFIPDS